MSKFVRFMKQETEWQTKAKENAQAKKLGPVNPEMVCPHCQVKGQVHTMPVKVKTGISGGKATAAVFTLGTSMLATGLSRKQEVLQATCGNCQTAWQIA